MNHLDKTAQFIRSLILLRWFHEDHKDSTVPALREAYETEARKLLDKLAASQPHKDLPELIATNQYMPKNLEEEARKVVNEILKA